jgi:2-phospho-L-lactate/phosphoenolpyruvate guanylyltransferase
MRTVAVLPVKRFAQAKQRLGDSLPASARRELAQAMVGDVLVALHETPQLDLLVVVTAEGPVAAAARYQGAVVVDDPAEQGQSAAALLGIARAVQEGAERVALVPGDCPALEPRELAALLESRAAVTIVPDRHGTGTNALLLAPPEIVEPSFGPDSCERHRDAARAAGVDHELLELESLLLDVDTGADLQALRASLGRHPGRAMRTRRVLARLLGERPAA